MANGANDLFHNCNLSRRGRGRSRSPAPETSKGLAALTFSKKTGFSTATCFMWQTLLLTSGTNRIWHVWRGRSPCEPLPQ